MIEFNILITKEDILARVKEEDIFKKYIDNFEELGKHFCSELRNDLNPTCCITELDTGLRYKDFGTGDSYNCFDYVMVKFNCSFITSLQIIARDFNVDPSIPHVELNSIKRKIKKKNKDIKIKSKEFTIDDLSYWQQFGINEQLLNKFNIKSLEYYWIEGNRFTVKDLAFAYCFGNYTYKILQPNDAEWKWISNANDRHVQGYNQLPFEGELLFITSSLKDVMVLDKLGYNAVAPASEVSYIPDDIIKELKIRFDKVIIYFNNDQPGILGATNSSIKYSCDFIHNPIDTPKDPSDYVKEYGLDKLGELIKIILI